jgi:hypothetical protein
MFSKKSAAERTPFHRSDVLVTALVISIAVGSSHAQRVVTYHNDNRRTGQNLNEIILTPTNVNVNTFGKLFTIPVDGKVDAQPLYLPGVVVPSRGTHNVLFVATENDTVYAFDADTGATLWQQSLLLSDESPSDNRNCSQVVPTIGVTATPVIDLSSGSNGTMYVVSMSKNNTGSYFQRLHALNVVTGTEEFGGPISVQASFPGRGDNSHNGQVVFDPKQYEERAGLLLLNGVVYTSWASHCDIRPYTGWLIGYDKTTLLRVNVLNITPNGNEGSIWASGAGPAADANGNIFFLAANGTFDATLNTSGFPINGDFGNGFIKVSTLNKLLTVADYFEMSNTLSESNADEDLGSGGALVLPAMKDAKGTLRYLAVGAGKDGNIYVIDRNHLGKFHPTFNGIYQELPGALAGPEFGMAAYFNKTLYYGAVGDVLRAFRFTNARLSSIPVSKTGHVFPYPGATPSISANGTANAIVWVAENGSTAALHAYDANDLSRELYNSNQAASGRDHFGSGNKFITPTVVNGKVYVGTTNAVAIFGLR